jgi:hypothetical protein
VTEPIRGKEQGDSTTPDVLRKKHMGRITIRDNWWPTTQRQLEKQAWQRTACQSREQLMTTRMTQVGREGQHLSDSPSLTSSPKNRSGTATSASTFANTITALFTGNSHSEGPQPQSLPLETKTQRFLGTGIGTIDKLTMDGQGPVAHHHTRKETLLPDKGTIKALEVAVSLKKQAHTLIHNVLKSLAGGRLFSKISI